MSYAPRGANIAEGIVERERVPRARHARGDLMADKLPTYTVVLRCTESQLRLPPGKGLLISPIVSEYGNYELRIQTRIDEESKFQSPIPRELWIEITGPAPSVEIAVNLSIATADQFVRQVAFGANAWQGLLTVHLGFESTPGRRDRAFFQNWVVDERGLPRPARTFDPDLLIRLLVALGEVPTGERPRITRAITQYSDALQYWKPGGELYALAHLYMGVEAITAAAISAEVRKRGLPNKRALEQIALRTSRPPLRLRIARWIYPRAGGQTQSALLDIWARREIIFRGDDETYRVAKRASDGLEHGFESHDAVHRLAVQCVEKCAHYLRRTILEILPMRAEDRDALLNKPYAVPANTGSFERQLLATITCESDEIYPTGQMYPVVRWEFNLLDFKITEEGKHAMRVTQKLTPMMSDKAKMTLAKIRFAGPTETTHDQVTVTVDRGSEDVAGIHFATDGPVNTKWVNPLGSVVLNCNALRYLSVFWLIRLGKARPEDIAAVSFADHIDEIMKAVSSPGVPEQLQERCKSGWGEALQLDEVREMLAGCATQPEGLVPLDRWAHGKAPAIGEVQRLLDLNDKAVQLCKELGRLLDELLHLPDFAPPANTAELSGTELR